MKHECNRAAATGPRILIIDDDASLRQTMAEALGDEGYQAVAVDQTKGLETARTLAPALILLDVLMPEIDGRALCRRLRADQATRAIPVVLVTGVPEFLLEPFRAYGGDWGYLRKPFTLDELVATVRVQLAQATAAGHS